MVYNDIPEDPDSHESDDEVIGRALRGSLLVLLVVALFFGFIWCWIHREKDMPPEVVLEQVLPQTRNSSEQEVPSLLFTDVSVAAGVDFSHVNGANGQKLLPETMGGGCAFLDYDSDGDQDLLLVNSNTWPWDETLGSAPTAALYSNDGTGHFRNVTNEAGFDVTLYGMGVAVGDFDNDGDPDVFLSAVGENRLLRNDGGRFVDTTRTSGLSGEPGSWSTSCGWLDYDNDGDLDLLVGNYVRWSKEIDRVQNFRLTGIGRAYGPPFSFEGSFPYLYRNEGDGTFQDVSLESGIQQTNSATGVPLAKTLGIALCDVNRDGWIDFVLANDTVRNLLFINQRDGTFLEQGIEAGIAFDSSGKAQGAMGIDIGCFRNDDCLGIAIANFANEMTALYVSDGPMLTFTDDAIPSGVGPPTRSDLAFGLFFFDADLDGRLDLLSANGHIENEINQVQKSQHYRQPLAFFWNAGAGSADEFVKLAEEQTSLTARLVGRGASYADIDADGDLDVLITQVADRPLLLRNDQQLQHHFIRLKLVGRKCNRDAIGAWIEVHLGQAVIERQVMPTRSYLSQVELPVTIGLADTTEIDRVIIRWPDGSTQKVDDVKIDAESLVTQAIDE